MKLLLTNDDGVDAPGLQALRELVAGIGEVVVVAPVHEFSGCSHRVTTHEPIRTERRGDNRYAVHGTPADCVRLGLHSLAKDTTWVLSGVNDGGNLGTDVHLSGTVSAVREAVLHGWPGIAVSQYRRRHSRTDWARSVRWARPVLEDLMARAVRPGTFWNVNLPDPERPVGEPEVVFCPMDRQPLPVSFLQDADHYRYDGDYHARHRDPGSDVDVCFSGRIAVTCVNLFCAAPVPPRLEDIPLPSAGIIHRRSGQSGATARLGPYEIEALLTEAEENAGTVYRVKLGPNERTATSYHREAEEYYFVLSGRGTAVLNGQEYPLRPGDFLRLPAGTTHGFVTGGEGLEMLDIHTPGCRPGRDTYFVDEGE